MVCRSLFFTQNQQSSANQHNLSFLVTDDNAMNRKLATRFIKNVFGKETEIGEAINGNDAVQKVVSRLKDTNASFDFILMDYSMPEMNGEQAAESIQQIEKEFSTNKPLFKPSFVCAWTTEENKQFGNGCLQKPFTRQAFLDLLSENGFLDPAAQVPTHQI